jgi:hypothetical protein
MKKICLQFFDPSFPTFFIGNPDWLFLKPRYFDEWVSWGIFCRQGFAHADEILLFRQKDPKPFPPVRGPPGDFATSPNQMARKLAPLKQSSPE